VDDLIVSFLHSCLAHDEAEAHVFDWADLRNYETEDLCASPEYVTLYMSPARMLAEVTAKRRIIEALLGRRYFLKWYGCAAVGEDDWGVPTTTGKACTCGRDAEVFEELRLLALPYAGRPGYREDWRPHPLAPPHCGG
jgi:hypothetical protein